MNIEAIVNKTKIFVKQELQSAEAGHDWWHIERVLKNTEVLSEGENVDNLVLQLACLLHDIGDAKFHNGNEEIGRQKILAFLAELSISEKVRTHVLNIVENISYRKHFDASEFNSKELEILQDADRLDAIGAVGIARAFSFGGFKGNAFYDPKVLPKRTIDKKTYKKGKNPTINHFYEKLLKLKSMMNTEKGKQLAEERHAFMVKFLLHFYNEAGIDASIYENFATQT
jgi:uncharacterized protein